MEILGLILGLVNNDGRHGAFPISSFEYKLCAPEWCTLSSFYLPHYFPLKELVSTHDRVPFTIWVKPYFITVLHFSGFWLDLMEVGWYNHYHLERKFVLVIFT